MRPLVRALSAPVSLSIALSVMLGAERPAHALDPDPPPPPLVPRHRIVYENLFALRVNPLGVEDQMYLGYRMRVHDDPAPLWRDGYVGVALTPTVNPALARIGGTVEVRPLTILLLSAGTYFVSWFGSQKHLQSYTSPSAAHSDSDLEAGEDAGLNYATTGAEVQLRAQLLAKVGPIVIRNDANFFGSQADLRDGDRVYYSIRTDMVVPNGGWSMTNDTDLVYLTDFGLLAGVRNTIGHAFYEEGDAPPGTPVENPNTPIVRLGPVGGYTFFDEPGAAFNKPTVLLIANWWLAHRYRTGADVTQALPYIVAAFRFEGDLWSSR